MICIDSNVWIYYFDATTAEHERVRPAMREALGERPLFANAVVPLEVTHYLVKRHEDGGRLADRLLNLDALEVEAVDASMVARANELLQAHPQTGIGGRDASLVAAMDRRGVEELWTHDQGLGRLGERLDWLTVEDPADPANPAG